MNNLMKQVILVLTGFVSLQNSTHAQNQDKSQGVISYDFTINLHANLSKEQQAYKAMIPEKTTQSVKLNFKNGNYRVEESEAEDKESGNISITISSNNDIKIVNKEKNYVSAIYKKGDKIYYTVNKVIQPKFTIDKESTKKILGYDCYKVVYTKGEDTYEIWVTTDLKLTADPLHAFDFGGTVLEINSKKINIKATKIDFKKQDDALFEIDKNAKKITNEQAEDLQEQSIKGTEKTMKSSTKVKVIKTK